ncbi:MAG: Endoglucanase [Armatimonadetes bacterium]|jgi:endoglucanase|nr:Endoglucanase [Armatimonadota bacterium]
MQSESLGFLRSLVEAGGPSGYEQPIQAIFKRQAEEYGATVSIDVLGNAVAVVNGEATPRVMLAGHADEIGFLVRYLDDDGFIYFAPVGGWDAEIAVGQRVTIWTANGPVIGVIGKRAIHLMDEEDRRKKSELYKLWIDIGVGSREEAEQTVEIGDPITVRATLELLCGDYATAKSFDNRMAVWICAETLRLLQGKTLGAGVYSVSTVQEEIGLRGARTSAFNINPQIGIALDVCHSTDYPDADKRKVGDIRLGRGPVVSRGANINPRVFELLLRAAREENIPIQIEAAPAGTGTDANIMQLNQAGMATGLISVAVRYMHSPCEMLSLTDLENAARLCAAFIERVTPEMDWTP